MATLIEFFDVPPSRDEAFLADWRRERGAAGAALYRAIRDETPVRFVSVAATPADGFELIREDGEPDGTGGVIQITTFATATEDFLLAWSGLHEIERDRRGYLGTRLYRATDLYIAIGRWSSPLMIARTQRRPEFARVVAALPARRESALYTLTTGA